MEQATTQSLISGVAQMLRNNNNNKTEQNSYHKNNLSWQFQHFASKLFLGKQTKKTAQQMWKTTQKESTCN